MDEEGQGRTMTTSAWAEANLAMKLKGLWPEYKAKRFVSPVGKHFSTQVSSTEG